MTWRQFQEIAFISVVYPALVMANMEQALSWLTVDGAQRPPLRLLRVKVARLTTFLRPYKDDQDRYEDDQDTPASEEEEEQIQYPFFTEGMQSTSRAVLSAMRIRSYHEDPNEDSEAETDIVVLQAREFVLDCGEIGVIARSPAAPFGIHM